MTPLLLVSRRKWLLKLINYEDVPTIIYIASDEMMKGPVRQFDDTRNCRSRLDRYCVQLIYDDASMMLLTVHSPSEEKRRKKCLLLIKSLVALQFSQSKICNVPTLFSKYKKK